MKSRKYESGPDADLVRLRHFAVLAVECVIDPVVIRISQVGSMLLLNRCIALAALVLLVGLHLCRFERDPQVLAVVQVVADPWQLRVLILTVDPVYEVVPIRCSISPVFCLNTRQPLRRRIEAN